MIDDRSGVVDEWLRFVGYSNLYACDVSVFPSIPAANPSLTLVALALRLADHLVAVVARVPEPLRVVCAAGPSPGVGPSGSQAGNPDGWDRGGPLFRCPNWTSSGAVG